MVPLGRAQTPIRVPAPILHVDDLACSVPPVLRALQILEIHGRLWVQARPKVRQADMVRGVLRQPFGREPCRVHISGVPLAGFAIAAAFAADVGVVNQTPGAV